MFICQAGYRFPKYVHHGMKRLLRPIAKRNAVLVRSAATGEASSLKNWSSRELTIF